MHEQVPDLHKVDPHEIVQRLIIDICAARRKRVEVTSCEMKAQAETRATRDVMLVEVKSRWALTWVFHTVGASTEAPQIEPTSSVWEATLLPTRIMEVTIFILSDDFVLYRSTLHASAI